MKIKFRLRNKYTSAPTRKAIAKVKRIFAKTIELSSLRRETQKDMPLSYKEAQEVELIKNSDNPTFYYKMSKFCRYITAISFSLIFIIGGLLLFISSGTYLSAWFISIAVAVFALYVISFPRKIVITDEFLRIHGILEITEIPLIDINRIQPIDRYRIKRHVPVLGSYGFGGFFGYYFDFIHLRVVHMFATKLDGLIMIQTLFHQRYILSCNYRDVFIDILRSRVNKARGEKMLTIDNSSEEEDIDDMDDDAS